MKNRYTAGVKRWTGRLLRWLSAVVLLLLLLLTVMFWLLQLTPIQQRIVHLLNDRFSGADPIGMHIEGLSGWLPLDFSVARFELSDAEGNWLELNNFRFKFSFMELFAGAVRVEALGVDYAGIKRLPRLDPSPKTNDRDKKEGGGLPAFLPDLFLDHFYVEELELGEPVLGAYAAFSVDFSALVTMRDRLVVSGSVNRTDGLLDVVNMEVALTNGWQSGRMRIDAQEGPGGLVEFLSDGEVSEPELHIQNVGTLANWPGQLRVAALVQTTNEVNFSGEYCLQQKKDFSMQWHITQPFVPGVLQGNLGVSGPLSQIAAAVHLEVGQINLTQLTDLSVKPFDIILQAVLDRGQLKTTVQTSGFPDCRLNGYAVIPMELALQPFRMTLTENSSLDGQLDGALNLRFIAPLLQTFQQNVSGAAQLHVDMSGRVGSPDLKGFLQMDDGLYENLSMGTLLRNIDLNAAFTDNQLNIKNFSANDAADGTLQVTGGITFSGKGNRPIDLRLKMDNATLINQTLASVTLDADIAISGNHENMSVIGTSVVKRAAINIHETLPPDVTRLKVEEINVPGQKQEKRKKDTENKKAAAIALNVAVKSSGRITVKGRGLDSEWRANILAAGSAARPNVTGGLDLVRGTFKFLGKQLVLSQCSVTFDGGWPIMPQIDIRADSITSELTCRLRIYGPANNPQIALSSEPSRPDDEILSMLLFGKRVDELSAVEALKIAYGISVLRGGGLGGGQLLSRAQQMLYVDQINIQQGSNEQTQLAVGKYIGNYIYIEGEKSLQGEGDAFKLQVDLTPNLQLKTKASSEEGEGQSIYINWHREY